MGGNPQKNGKRCRVLRYHNLPLNPHHRKNAPTYSTSGARAERALARVSAVSILPRATHL